MRSRPLLVQVVLAATYEQGGQEDYLDKWILFPFCQGI